VVIEARREEAETAAALAAPVMDDAAEADVIGGDEFDTLVVDTPESRD
jgi:DNA-directed RNA polymerase subunit beta'